MAKSAVEKIGDSTKKHKIIENLPANIPWASEGSSMVVSTPAEVYAIVNAIPQNKLLTITTIREYLSQKYGADITCPVSTGIFINIAANASEVLRLQNKDFAPYWRVLRADGSLNPKYPNGTEEQEGFLRAEGFTLKRIRKLIVVENFKDYLWDINPEACVF